MGVTRFLPRAGSTSPADHLPLPEARASDLVPESQLPRWKQGLKSRLEWECVCITPGPHYCQPKPLLGQAPFWALGPQSKVGPCQAGGSGPLVGPKDRGPCQGKEVRGAAELRAEAP